MKKTLLILVVLFLVNNADGQVKHIITSDGVDLYVTVKGNGPPCLYLHGGPGSGSHWLGKFAGDSLEKHFQMIYLDQRGVGLSSSPQDKNYSMDRMVNDFEDVREALGISQWITLGHSFGGLLQMGYIMRHPSSVKAMIMINCSLNMELCYKSSWCPKACEFLGINDRQYFEDQSIPLHTRWDSLISSLNNSDMMWKMGFASREDMELMNSTYGELPSWNGDFGEVAMTMDDYAVDFTNATESVKVPVLFFYGTRDWMIGPEHYKGAGFPDMMLWPSDTGHMPFLENKADMIEAINCFMKEKGL
jgi:proline iminopeptidase